MQYFGGSRSGQANRRADDPGAGCHSPGFLKPRCCRRKRAAASEFRFQVPLPHSVLQFPCKRATIRPAEQALRRRACDIATGLATSSGNPRSTRSPARSRGLRAGSAGRARGQVVRLIGSGHSWSALCATEDYCLNLGLLGTRGPHRSRARLGHSRSGNPLKIFVYAAAGAGLGADQLGLDLRQNIAVR